MAFSSDQFSEYTQTLMRDKLRELSPTERAKGSKQSKVLGKMSSRFQTIQKVPTNCIRGQQTGVRAGRLTPGEQKLLFDLYVQQMKRVRHAIDAMEQVTPKTEVTSEPLSL